MLVESRRIVGGDAARSRRIIGRNRRITCSFRREQRSEDHWQEEEDRRRSKEDWIVSGARRIVGKRKEVLVERGAS